MVKVTAELAQVTPVCACMGYIEEGAPLRTVRGSAGNRPAWWVACPDCGSALGRARRMPIALAISQIPAEIAAEKRRVADEQEMEDCRKNYQGPTGWIED